MSMHDERLLIYFSFMDSEIRVGYSKGQRKKFNCDTFSSHVLQNSDKSMH